MKGKEISRRIFLHYEPFLLRYQRRNFSHEFLIGERVQLTTKPEDGSFNYDVFFEEKHQKKVLVITLGFISEHGTNMRCAFILNLPKVYIFTLFSLGL